MHIQAFTAVLPNNPELAETRYSDCGRPLDIDVLLQDFEPVFEKESIRTANGEFNIGGIQITDTTPGALINKSMHCRDRLLRIICACYHSGKSIEDTAERIADYDLRYHHSGNGINNAPTLLTTTSIQNSEERRLEISELSRTLWNSFLVSSVAYLVRIHHEKNVLAVLAQFLT
ncbi:hypothetical protein IOQ59_09245 [Pontibacterium sp. N1Y112]|uniref:Uncharacterized protein n=1 Tax=Pontibacterium sinense TaxID=2781979 RepID=A0A8J7K5T3_9GAMM|nr:hypothetical protein [Pontibacterium sinense]MBE9397445.1 hypothetical protein [Pontibacterium sinense]